jgi:nucleoid-associated protein YgaU
VTRDGATGSGATAVRDSGTRDSKAVAPAAATKTYTVASGDTLEKIAKRIAPSKVPETVTKLAAMNKIKDPAKLQVGQVLKVPA